MSGVLQQFEPPVWLRSPHLQTVLSSAVVRRSVIHRSCAGLMTASQRQVIDCGKGVRLYADVAAATDGSYDQLVVLIHGWEGSAESMYLLSAGQRFRDAGFAVMRLNLRDHGDSHHLNEDLFHSCRLQEVSDAVARAQELFEPGRLILGGFSLGGNFSLRVAAKAAESGLALDRVLAVCPVLDPEETMYALDGGWFLYRKYFLHKWSRSLRKKMRVFPDKYSFGDLRRFKTLEAMTDFFVINHTEYPDLHSYLKGYSLEGDRLAGLNVDSRVLLADDDPVIPVAGLQRVARSDALQVTTTELGGHCGYLQSAALDSWANNWLMAQL